VLTVVPLNGVALVAEGPITGCTVSAPGKATYVPDHRPHERLLLLGEVVLRHPKSNSSPT
jgi:hypothetical protein